MNLLNKDLNQLIQLRKSRFKNWLFGLIYLNCLQFSIRFLIMTTADYFEYSKYIMKGSFFDLSLNLGKFNKIYFVFTMFPIYSIYVNYCIVYKSGDHIWDPLLTTLIRDNWNQFIKDNFNYRPTFSLIEGLRRPTQTLKSWKGVFNKLQNYRLVHFTHRLRLFPYMNRRIRVEILFNLLKFEIYFKFIFQICGEFNKFIFQVSLRNSFDCRFFLHWYNDLFQRQNAKTV